MKNKKTTLTLSQKLLRIKEISVQIQNNELDIETNLELYNEGKMLVDECLVYLEQTEAQLKTV